MKINLSKLVRVILHVVAGAPAVAAALKPALDELRKPGSGA